MEALASLGNDSRDLLATMGVDLTDEGAVRTRSSLNNDGTPLQVCVGVGQHGRAIRVLADPATGTLSPELRLHRALTTLRRLLRRLPSRPDASEFLAVLIEALPDGESLASLPRGVMWVASDVGHGGVGAYVTGRWGESPSRWPRAIEWVRQWIGPAAAAALGALHSDANLASLGVETDGESIRAKVYFRPAHLVSERIPTTFPLPNERFERFLSLAVGRFAVRRSGLVLCLSGTLGADRIDDAKVDVCGHCTPRTTAEWTSMLERLCSTFGLTDLGVGQVLTAGWAEPAFVGFGITRDGASRLNVYLKEPSADRDAGLVDEFRGERGRDRG